MSDTVRCDQCGSVNPVEDAESLRWLHLQHRHSARSIQATELQGGMDFCSNACAAAWFKNQVDRWTALVEEADA